MYAAARGVTNDVTKWRLRVEWWISKTKRKHAHANAHSRGHKHARARTHTHTRNIYCFSTATVIREPASILRYTYIACLVLNSCWSKQ